MIEAALQIITTPETIAPYQVKYADKLLASCETRQAARDYRNMLHVVVVIGKIDEDLLLFERNHHAGSSEHAGWLWQFTGTICHNISNFDGDQISPGDTLVISNTEIEPYKP